MVASKPTLGYFSGTENLGVIYREQQQLNLKIQQANIPLTTSGGNISYNFGGKTRILVVQAAHDGSGFVGATANAKLRDFIERIEQWVNASVTFAETFYDSFGEPYNVIPSDFTWERSNRDPERIIYTLVMIETGAT